MSTYKVQIAATFLSRSQSIAFVTDHVRPDGVFIRTDAPPPVMALLRIEFVLPPLQAKVILHGTVVRVALPTGKGSAPGVEIAFFAKEGESSAMWDHFIQHVRDTYPESVTQSVYLAQDAIDQVRRSHARVVPVSPIQILGDDANRMVVGDISKGGMFIRTDAAFTVGTTLRATLEDPRTRARIRVDCVVRRCVLGAKAGIGVEFRDLAQAQRAALAALIGAAGGAEPVTAQCDEVHAPLPPKRRNTLPGGWALGVVPAR